MQLYADQEIFVDAIRQAFRDGAKAPLGVAPTGSGKTQCFSFICKGAQARGHGVIIMAHRIELIDQISNALTSWGVSHGIIAAGYRMDRGYNVYVASVFTLIKRLDFFHPDLIVIDEAHHCTATTVWGRIAAAYPKARRLGVTATPCRMGGQGLGDMFDKLVMGPTPQELISMGRLCPLEVWAPPTVNTDKFHKRGGDFARDELITAFDKPSITGSAVEHYKKLVDNTQAAAFCISIEHAKHVAGEFRAAGYSAESIDGTLDREIRRSIIEDYARGKIKVLTSCDLISEGFDCPRIEVGISLRPTQSLGLWLQQCGRILRTHLGKTRAVLLDHAGNTLRHGLPTEDRAWSLAVSETTGKRTGATPGVRICPACFSAQPSRKPRCQLCGAPFPVEPRKVEKKKGQLEKLTPEMLAASAKRQEVGMTRDLAALTELGRFRGYKDPAAWAKHVWEGRELKRRRMSNE